MNRITIDHDAAIVMQQSEPIKANFVLRLYQWRELIRQADNDLNGILIDTNGEIMSDDSVEKFFPLDTKLIQGEATAVELLDVLGNETKAYLLILAIWGDLTATRKVVTAIIIDARQKGMCFCSTFDLSCYPNRNAIRSVRRQINDYIQKIGGAENTKNRNENAPHTLTDILSYESERTGRPKLRDELLRKLDCLFQSTERIGLNVVRAVSNKPLAFCQTTRGKRAVSLIRFPRDANGNLRAQNNTRQHSFDVPVTNSTLNINTLSLSSCCRNRIVVVFFGWFSL